MVSSAQRRRLTGFETNLTVGDGDAAFDTSAECAALVESYTGVAGFSLIWQKTVPAQQIIRWGSGSALTQRNQGFMFFYALDAGTGFEDGILRLVVANARETTVQVVKEMNTQRLHTVTATNSLTPTPTDINEMIALPEQVGSPAAGEDSLLQLYFSSRIQTTTVDVLGFSIPCTVYQ